jgi:phosphatidylglycerol:prolipoprotein diacylglycerol transferase
MIDYIPHQILFELGPIKVPSYGFMLGIAFLAAFLWFYTQIKNQKMLDHTLVLLALAIFSAIIGGRGLFVLLNYKHFLSYPIEIFYVWDGGLVFYGAFALFFLFAFIYFKKYKLVPLLYLDYCAVVLALGLGITRIGCFLNWCCYGIQSNLPWAIKVAGDVARHPTQIYSSIFNFALFLFLWFVLKKKYSKGMVTALFFMLYGGFRFLIDFIRYYEGVYYFGFLTAFQIISLISIAVGLFILLRKK